MNIPNAIPMEQYEKRKQASGPAFDPVPLSEIMAMQFGPLRWAVEGYLPDGLSILAGRQKTGKTWLALDFAIALAMGGAALGGVLCEEGDVLYLDLENGRRRIQQRTQMLVPHWEGKNWLARVQFATKCRSLGSGLVEDLECWRLSVPNPRLVVIDVLQRAKPPGKPGQTSYESDYATLAPLQSWATDSGIAVLVLHHTRKGGAEDPLEALSGSNGLSACADTTLVLNRDGNGTTLYVRGRDVEEKETALRFDGGQWSVIGDAMEVKRSKERNAILQVLRESDVPLGPTDIAAATGTNSENVRFLLHKMTKDGEVERVKRGQYRPAESR